MVEDGYEFFAKRQLVTLFSAPNYCGEFDNAGAMMSVDESLLCSFQVSLSISLTNDSLFKDAERSIFSFRSVDSILCLLTLCGSWLQLAPLILTDPETSRQEAQVRCLRFWISSSTEKAERKEGGSSVIRKAFNRLAQPKTQSLLLGNFFSNLCICDAVDLGSMSSFSGLGRNEMKASSRS